MSRLDSMVPAVEGLFAVAPYTSGFGQAIAACKSQRRRSLAKIVSQTWARRMAPFAGDFDLIVPAPSTSRSLMRRGFSVASLMASALSLYTGVPYQQALVVSGGPQQAMLSREERVHNLQDRVRCRQHMPARVLWVDDVVTTGGSASASASALRRGGAKEVWGAVVCVTTRHSRRLVA